jgi:beta-lactamase superfamily II metal-dependent hydrolase
MWTKRTLVSLFLFVLIFGAFSVFTACNSEQIIDEQTEIDSQIPSDTATEKVDKEYSGNTIRDNEFVIFENGNYTCPIVLSESASEIEKEVYKKVRDKFKSITGKLAKFTTDFKAYNDSGDLREEPAILIGNTNYDESAKVYDELRYCEGKLLVSGNKLIVAFSSSDDANAMYLELVKLLQNSTEEKVSIDLSVNVSKISNEALSELPSCPIGTAYAIDCDDDTNMVRIDEATEEAFLEFCDKLKKNGYESIVSRKAGVNSFETLIKGEKYVHVYYKPYNNALRAVVGDVSSLPDYEQMKLEVEKKTDPSLTMVGQAYSDIGLGMIFKLYDGRFVIIDGGAYYKKDLVYKALSKQVGEGEDIVIAAWFLTHAHGDHNGGFTEFVDNHIDEVKIENVVYNFAPASKYEAIAGEENNKSMTEIRQMIAMKLAKDTRIIKVHTGQVLSFGGVDFEILYTPEDFYPANFDYLNLTSLIVRANIGGTTVLSLADATHTLGTVLINSYGDYLKSDMVQLAHHGMWASVDRLYDIVDADVLIWPSNSTAAKEWINDGAVRAALKPAIDVYLPGSKTITINFPYVFQNNKDKFIENHS